METRNGIYLDSEDLLLSILENSGWYPHDDFSNLGDVKYGWSLALGNEQVRVGATLIMPMELML